MASYASTCAKWTLDIAPRAVKANVRLSNLEALQDDMAVIFVVNHFTRLETLLLPYALQKLLGKEVWSLISEEALHFRGRIGAFLRSTATVSTRDPDRDKVVVRSLLLGEHPWVMFPEGAMARDKKDVHHHGMFFGLNNGMYALPPMSAAVLALRTEYYRRGIEVLFKGPDQERLALVLQQFGLESYEQVLAKRTVLVPVNVTYFPLRAYDNVFLRLARHVIRDAHKRVTEELPVEGTLLSKDTDITIALGTPIDVKRYLDAPEYQEIAASSPDDFRVMEVNAKSPFSDAARRLMSTCASDVRALTAINIDHILAALVKYQWGNTFKDRAFRDRILLCAHHVRQIHKGPIHPELADCQRDILRERPNKRFDDFLGLCEREGLLTKADGVYGRRPAAPGFSSSRRDNPIEAILNEIEPLADEMRVIRRIALTPGVINSYLLRTVLFDQDRRLFEDDYASHFQEGASKGPDVGRPFLLKPFLPAKGAIVLIHGYMAAPLEVRVMAEHLRRNGYAVYGIRLKGHGTSPADLSESTWEDWFESIERAYAIAETLSETIIVGGFSMGAGLALLAAARKKASTRAVFAIDTPMYLRNSSARFAPSIVRVNTLLKRFRWGRSRWEYVENHPENRHINYLSNPISGVAELGEAMDVMRESLGEITAPTLVVQGSRDPIVDPSGAQAVFDKVGTRHKLLVILERDRHGIINGPDARDVYEHVCHFLAWAREKNRESRQERPRWALKNLWLAIPKFHLGTRPRASGNESGSRVLQGQIHGGQDEKGEEG